ncbi:MAG: class II fructose-bisphosphate aldolase [bacterium]|nr:class II fructose-bisphosphate aldolase [bacterium]
MAFESAAKILKHAYEHHYAVGYFESWDLVSIQGVIDAAEESQSPIIIGFSGDFLSRPERDAEERIEIYGALARAAADTANVPCAVIFNECPRSQWVEKAIVSGFNLVMFSDHDASYEDYVTQVADLCELAHSQGVSMEAEVGELASGDPRFDTAKADPSDPDLVSDFIKRTNVDVVSVSVGNVHVMTTGQTELDLERLKLISEQAKIPLVLHGGSGIAPESLRQAIELGVSKVNYGTYIKQRYLSAVRAALQNHDANPHHLLGYGGKEDLLTIGRQAVRNAVLERIDLLGCCGKT